MAEPVLHGGAWWHRQPDGSLLRWDQEAGQWVPAPAGEGPGAEHHGGGDWKPIDGRAKTVRMLLFALAGISAAALISDGYEWSLFDQAIGGDPYTESQATLSDNVQLVFGILLSVTNLAVIVTFLMWLFRAYKNVLALGAGQLRYRPGWSIGAWFIPFFNFVGPKQIVNDTWRASDPDLPPDAGGAWRGAAIPAALFGWWWAAWILSALLGNASFRVNLDAESLKELREASAVDFASDLATIPACLLCAAVVAAITRRQNERAARLGVRAAG